MFLRNVDKSFPFEPIRRVITAKEAYLPANEFAGSPKDRELVLKPEVVAKYDDAGHPLTMSLFVEVSPYIFNPRTMEKVRIIEVASFGQNDPVRLWMAAECVSKIFEMPTFIAGMRSQVRAFMKRETVRPRLDRAIYSCLNAAFYAQPGHCYGGEGEPNIHNTLPVGPWPEEVINEIVLRLQRGHPLNYQYLDYRLKESYIADLLTPRKVVDQIKTRAEQERYRSHRHRDQLLRENDWCVGAYGEINSLLDKINFNIYFEGGQVMSNDIKRILRKCSLDLNAAMISSEPLVNFAHSIICTTIDILTNTRGFNMGGHAVMVNLIADHIREALTQRIYEVAFQSGVLDEEMTLGDFADQVYQLYSNNNLFYVRDHMGKFTNLEALRIPIGWRTSEN